MKVLATVLIAAGILSLISIAAPARAAEPEFKRSDHYPLRRIRNRSFDDQGLGVLRSRGGRRKTNLV